MNPNKIRKAYSAMFLQDSLPVKLDDSMDDARQEIIAVLRRLQTELERISGLAAEQGDEPTMTAAQTMLDRVAWIRGAVNRDLVAYLDSSADLAEAYKVVEDANDRLSKVAAGTARAIARYEKIAPVLGSIEKLIKFVKDH